MKLRAHHLLCLPNFIGEGYSDAFTVNMAARKRQLAAEGGFTLTDGADDVCAACPHRRRGEACEVQDKVSRYDAAVRRLLGLEPGKSYSAAALEERVRTELFEKHRLAEICGDCEWYPLCASLTGERKEGQNT